MAQDAMLRLGAFAFSTASASGHREASAPPRTGSITMHGRPYSCNISYCSRARCGPVQIIQLQLGKSHG